MPNSVPENTREVHKTHTVDKGGIVTMRPSDRMAAAVDVVPKIMDTDDRRLVFEAISEMYVSKEKGYKAGQSDQTVAVSLHVPAGWVREVRELFFGPAGNEKRDKEVRELRGRLDALDPKIKEITSGLADLISEAQAIHLALKTLEKE